MIQCLVVAPSAVASYQPSIYTKVSSNNAHYEIHSMDCIANFTLISAYFNLCFSLKPDTSITNSVIVALATCS